MRKRHSQVYPAHFFPSFAQGVEPIRSQIGAILNPEIEVVNVGKQSIYNWPALWFVQLLNGFHRHRCCPPPVHCLRNAHSVTAHILSAGQSTWSRTELPNHWYPRRLRPWTLLIILYDRKSRSVL